MLPLLDGRGVDVVFLLGLIFAVKESATGTANLAVINEETTTTTTVPASGERSGRGGASSNRCGRSGRGGRCDDQRESSEPGAGGFGGFILLSGILGSGQGRDDNETEEKESNTHVD